ncbi:MAG TPA: DUF4307 domain-containing protein [Propionibacteriaceae bacterium]|jgi:hypothetical protein|nr:DUF4307 domain-containing protein [Propionibacteriaceae bacterium]
MSDAAERLRLRYPPPRVPRPVVVVLVVVGAALGLGWLIWAALFHATPPVSGQMSAFQVVSDTEIVVTLTVDRRDPAQPVSCRVLAQGEDLTPVGEQQVQVPGAAARVVNTQVRLVTLRRALTATVQDCQVS